MYEMYPESWPAVGERRSPELGDRPPRRRPRKEHAVLPPALTVRRPAEHGSGRS